MVPRKSNTNFCKLLVYINAHIIQGEVKKISGSIPDSDTLNIVHQHKIRLYYKEINVSFKAPDYSSKIPCLMFLLVWLYSVNI